MRLDGDDVPRHLGDHARHGRQPVNAVRGERLEVGLHARARRAIRAGDGQRDGGAGRGMIGVGQD